MGFKDLSEVVDRSKRKPSKNSIGHQLGPVSIMSSSANRQTTASTSSSSMLALKAMIAEQKASGKREEKKPTRVQPTVRWTVDYC
jgi:hypothetical protein